jgi:hypothetical protein
MHEQSSNETLDPKRENRLKLIDDPTEAYPKIEMD